MAAQKPLLHELLQEDQEPFLLKDYIANRHFQIKNKPKQISRNVGNLQIKKRSRNINFCKNACFFSVNNSPDYKKSPLFEFSNSTPVTKSPKNPNSNGIFLHIPSKTATLLLEAALRIHKQSQKSKNGGTSSFGLFGSFIKRLKSKSKKHNEKNNTNNSRKFQENLCLRSNNGASWSEENQENSRDFDASISSQEMEMDFFNKLIDFNDHCDSPFHFVLKRSSPPPFSGHRTPLFFSPATSPCRHKTDVKENNNDQESLGKFQENVDHEEDKEQCSPVSVLDPPFEDDYDGNDVRSEEDGFDLECSYAFVQRAKQQLLQKLRRFEKLAELDPVELEKRMLEDGEDLDDDDELDEEAECEDVQTVLSETEQNIDEFVIEELSKSSFNRLRKVPKDMKRLVSDLVNEEEREQNCCTDKETTAKRVCKRFESWKEVKSNTIDMMVEQDFNKELDKWKRYQEEIGQAALEIELGIFGFLVEELVDLIEI